MNLGEFFKIFWIDLLVGGIVTGIIFIAYSLVARWISEEYKKNIWIKRSRNGLLILVWTGIVVTIILAASMNLFPRSQIDRTNLDKSQQNWEQRHSK